METKNRLKMELELDGQKYVEIYISILNIFLPKKLTKKEMEVLAAFISLPSIITDRGMFNPYARKLVMEKLGLSRAGLSNYLNSLTKSGHIVNENGKLRMRNFLIPKDKEQNFSINIKVKE